MDTLEQAPEIEDVLNMLGGQINDEEMQRMNYEAEAEGKDVEKVVKDFLKNKGLIN